MIRPPTDRRIYLFSPTAWQLADLARAIAALAPKI